MLTNACIDCADPPAAPTCVTSDWDGSTKTPDTVITYTCQEGTSPANVMISCNGTTGEWNKTTIDCDTKVCEDPSGVTLEFTSDDRCLGRQAYLTCATQSASITSTCSLTGTSAAWSNLTCPDCCAKMSISGIPDTNTDINPYNGEYTEKRDADGNLVKINEKVYYEMEKSPEKYCVWWHKANRWVASKCTDSTTFTTLSGQDDIPLKTASG